MQSLKKIVMISAFVFFSTATMAETWDVVQSYSNTDGSTTLKQDGTGGKDGIQALNHINLNRTDGTVGSGTASTQSVDTTGQVLSLSQSETVSSSAQAANRISAQTVSNAEQILTGGSQITLDQQGNANIQAINDVDAKVITTLTQKITNDSVIDLKQGVGSTSTGTSKNEQALNRIHSGDSTIAVGDTGAVLQEVTATSLTFEQGDKIAPGSVQSGNLINAVNTSNIASDVKQNINTKGLYFNQNSTLAVLQAANALINDNGGAATALDGGVTQSITVEGVAELTQNAVDGSYQAANYLGMTVK